MTALAPVRRTVAVRPAVPNDVDGIITTMRVAHAESERVLPPIEMPHTRNWAISILQHAASYVATDGTAIVGVLMTAPVHLSWSTRPCMYESMHFFVLKPYRKAGTAHKLIERAKTMSDATGLPLQLGISYGGMPELKDRFVRLEGFEYVGGTHIYAPRPPSGLGIDLPALPSP